MRLIMKRLGLLVLAGFAACSRGRSDEGSASAAQDTGVGERVTLSEAAYRTAGIAVEEVRLDTGVHAGGGIEVPGQVEFDRTRIALLSPRTAGESNESLWLKAIGSPQEHPWPTSSARRY